MKYSDEFKKYLAGNLDEAKASEFESDVEKVKTITEYLDEQMDSRLYVSETSEPDKESKSEQKKTKDLINRSVNRKLLKYNLIVGSFLLAVILFLSFGLSPLLNAMYYNPGKKVGTAYPMNQIDLPLSIFTELHFGDQGFYDGSNVVAEGYGKYSVDAYTQFNGINHNYFTIEKSELQGVNNHFLFSDMPINIFSCFSSYYCPEKADVIQTLADLPASSRIKAAISFNESIDMTELSAFMTKYDAYFIYIPIQVSDGPEFPSFLGYFGFELTGSGTIFTELYDPEKYPYLDLVEYNIENPMEDEQFSFEPYPAQIYEEHFLSMLHYMNDQKTFNQVFNNTTDYAAVMKYVEENGIRTYGVVVYASPEQIEKMLNDELYDGFSILDVSVSAYSH